MVTANYCRYHLAPNFVVEYFHDFMNNTKMKEVFVTKIFDHKSLELIYSIKALNIVQVWSIGYTAHETKGTTSASKEGTSWRSKEAT